MAARTTLVFAAALIVATGAATRADALDVTRFDDPAGQGQPGDLSLRQAVLLAGATQGSDTITLHAGTYRLALRGDDATAEAGDLDIAGVVTIEGDAAGGTVIDAKKVKDRAFEVLGSGDLTLRHVTVKGGKTPTDGGGIHNVGNVTVENCTFSANSAGNSGGAIGSTGGVATLTDVVMTKNKAGNDGGGCNFEVGGSAALTRVSVSRNKAGDTGGGLNNDDGTTVTVANSTFSNNRAKHEGGGFDPGVGTLTLTNVTISRNRSAKGGGIQLENGGFLFLNNVTITGNKAKEGGGLWTEAGTTATLFATIVAKNKPFDCFGPLESEGSNLIGKIDGSTFSGNTSGNQVGNRQHPLDPKLGPLANNGGPTLTHALLAGSPALGGVAFGCPVTDQRGQSRSSPCDVGAFEGP